MKKTLITLLALGSVAMADDAFSWTLDVTSTLPTSTILTSAQCETAQLTMSDWTATYSANGATPVTLEFVDTSAAGAPAYSANQLVCKNPTYVLEAGRKTDVVSFSFSLKNEGVGKITIDDFATTVYACSGGGGNQGSARGGEMTLLVDGVSQTLSPKGFSVASGSTASVGFSDLGIELASGESVALTMNFTNNGGSRWFLGLGDVRMQGVPEPATATLSLLALAGLASRRRRH